MLRALMLLCLFVACGTGAVAAPGCVAGRPSAAETCSSGSSADSSVPSDSDHVGLLAHSVRRHRAAEQPAAGEEDCDETAALLAEYGSDIGSQGELFGLGEQGLFYTWSDFLSAVCMYNSMAAAQSKPAFLGDPDIEINGLTLVALMANLEVETLHWTACKERVLLADGTCPCTPPCTGGCSGGKIGDYTSAKAEEAGWSVTTCDGAVAPSKGCVDFWGNQVEDPKNCWFGRGATQLTWPGNYGLMQSTVKAAANVDICADPDSICNSDTIAWLTAIAYWQMNSEPWDKAHTFESSLEVIRPYDTSANPQREANFDAWTAALGIQPPTAAPLPDQGTTTVESGEGCWQITDRVCPGKGNDWATIICDPMGCSPQPALGATVTYNCNGC